jgi:uncharacterized protein (UPF0548 family)
VVKTRSGFSVRPPVSAGGVREEERYWLRARLGPVSLREPVAVVAVVTEPERRGFAYGTPDGHPVPGEEAFVAYRATDGTVWLTPRSLARPGRGPWRALYPVVVVAQRWYRWRYERAPRGQAVD